MIEITPSILTNDLEQFKELLNKFKNFKSIDIDIVREPFVQGSTLQLNEILELLTTTNIKLGIHLMVEVPLEEVTLLRNSDLSNKALTIFVHQEAETDFLRSWERPITWTIGVVSLLSSKLKNLEYYKNFDEVQFMSIEAGKQGNSFNEDIGSKIEMLRELGYNGKISLDGGINLNTAKIIKDWPIDRVSVGSYFKKADDIELAKMKLELALNMRNVA